MAEGGFDDYNDFEMKEREQQEQQEQQERQEAEQAEQETNFDDDDVVVDLNDDRPRDVDDVRVDLQDNLDDLLDEIGKDTHNVRRATTNNTKKVFKNVFDVTLEKKNGPNSKIVLDNTEFIAEKNGSIGIEYKGKRVGRIGRNLDVNLFVQKNKKFTNEFKQGLDKAAKEYERTPNALVEEMSKTNLPNDVVDNILNSSVEEIDQRIDKTAAGLSEQDLREFAGVLDPKGATAEGIIKALEIQAEYWEKVKLEAKEVADSDDVTAEEKQRARSKQTLFDSLERTAKLQADNERLKNNEKPIHDETLEIINDEILTSDLGRLERFKEWAKRNLVGLSAIAITIAGIVTTVVIAGRRAVKSAANATGKLAKALVNIGKKLGPLIAPMLNLMAQAITWGAKGIEFLSKNLWLIAVAFAWFLYDMYKNKK